MLSQAPFLFVDVAEGREHKKETSYWNEAEVAAVEAIFNHCLSIFNQSFQRN